MELCGRLPEPAESKEQDGSPVKENSAGSLKQAFDGSPADLKSFEPIHAENFDPTVHSIFIGHGVQTDLKVLQISDVPYYCTQLIDRDPQYNQTRKLKVLVEKHLNAEIQEGHHSSIIDARASLALFLKMRTVYGLEIDGPTFLTSNISDYRAKQRKGRKNRGYTTSQMIHR